MVLAGYKNHYQNYNNESSGTFDQSDFFCKSLFFFFSYLCNWLKKFENTGFVDSELVDGSDEQYIFSLQNIQFWALPVPYELTLKCFLAIKPCASILRFMLLEHTTATLKRKDKLSQISLLLSVLWFKDAWFRSSSLFTSKSFIVYTFSRLIHKSLQMKGANHLTLQVNLCQKLLFLHQLTHNITTHTCRTCCVHKLLFLFWHSVQFWYTTCSAYVASFWKRFTYTRREFWIP